MKNIPRVDIKQSPKKIDQFCRKYNSWSLVLDENMSSKEIGKLFHRHIKSKYCSNDVLGEIAGHSNAPIRNLMVLARIAGDDILLSLTLNSKMTDEIAEIVFKRTGSYDVLEPLILNPKISSKLLKKQLSLVKDPDLKKLIKKRLKSN